jgi:hypothetical protein
VHPPTNVPGKGKGSIYSVQLRNYTGSENPKAQQEVEAMKYLSDVCADKCSEFLAQNDQAAKQFAKTTFGSLEELHKECKVVKLWMDSHDSKENGSFLMRFRSTTVVSLHDKNESDRQKKTIVNPIKGDPIRFLGPGSLISLMFKPISFYYLQKKKLFTLSPEITRITIWVKKENKNSNAKPLWNTKRHGLLKQGLEYFSLKTPFGYEGPNQQMEIPVHDVETFNCENLKFSNVIVDQETKKLKMYVSAGDSFGPVYVRGKILPRFGIKRDPNYGKLSFCICDDEVNRPWITLMEGCLKNYIHALTRNSKTIWGRDYDAETVEDLMQTSLYSKNDVSQSNPRVTFKLGELTEKEYKALFDLYVVTPPSEEEEHGKIDLIENNSAAEKAEEYLPDGTMAHVVAMLNPVFVDATPYFSIKVCQIMVNPDQERVISPPLSGFSFPGFENTDVEVRSKTQGVPLDVDKIVFSKPVKNAKGAINYQVMVKSDDDHLHKYLVSPICKVAYDIGLEHDPKNGKYGYKNTHHFDEQDPKDQQMFQKIRSKHLDYVSEKSEDIFGKKRSKVSIEASMDNSLIKFSKKDVEKKIPFWSVKVPVYENKNGGFDIAFEAYRYIPTNGKSDSKDLIEKINLNSVYDLHKVFHKGAKIQYLFTQRAWYVNNSLAISNTAVQVLLYPSDDVQDIAFVDQDVSSIIPDSCYEVPDDGETNENHEEIKVQVNEESTEANANENRDEKNNEEGNGLTDTDTEKPRVRDPDSAESENEEEEEEEEEDDDEEESEEEKEKDGDN